MPDADIILIPFVMNDGFLAIQTIPRRYKLFSVTFKNGEPYAVCVSARVR